MEFYFACGSLIFHVLVSVLSSEGVSPVRMTLHSRPISNISNIY
jgi:hypothetical protein